MKKKAAAAPEKKKITAKEAIDNLYAKFKFDSFLLVAADTEGNTRSVNFNVEQPRDLTWLGHCAQKNVEESLARGEAQEFFKRILVAKVPK